YTENREPDAYRGCSIARGELRNVAASPERAMRVPHSFLLLGAITLTPVAVGRIARAEQLEASAASASHSAETQADTHSPTAPAAWTSGELEPGVFDIIVNGRPAGDSVVLLRGQEVLMTL